VWYTLDMDCYSAVVLSAGREIKSGQIPINILQTLLNTANTFI